MKYVIQVWVGGRHIGYVRSIKRDYSDYSVTPDLGKARTFGTINGVQEHIDVVVGIAFRVNRPHGFAFQTVI